MFTNSKYVAVLYRNKAGLCETYQVLCAKWGTVAVHEYLIPGFLIRKHSWSVFCETCQELSLKKE